MNDSPGLGLTVAAVAILFIGIMLPSRVLAAESNCPYDSPRCWYVIWSTGDAPERHIFVVSRVEQPDLTVRRIEVIEAFERASPIDHAIYVLEFDCKPRRFRVVSGTLVGQDQVQSSQRGSDWASVAEGSLADRQHVFACDSNAVANPTSLSMLYFGSLYRASDVVDFLRKFLWGSLGS